MIIICDKYRKDKILNQEKSNELHSIKFMSKKEFIKNFYFDFDNETIYELCKYYKCNYDTAKIFLKNIYYIDDKEYYNEKLNKLVEIKRFLEDNKLLKYNNLFKENLKYNEIVFDSINLTKFDYIMIEELKKITDVTIKDKEYNDYTPTIYEFNNIDEEVEYVAYKICDLIESGVDISKIKIAGINKDYDNSINRIFGMYNLKIRKEVSIFSTKTVRDFLNHYCSDIRITIDYLKNNNLDIDVINEIIDIVNNYSFIEDYELVKKFIIEDLKNKVITIHYDNEIEIIDINECDIHDEYVFYLNYNQESVPKIYLDQDYITNDIRNLTKLDCIEKLNKNERMLIARNLKNIKNLVITYKLKSPFSSFNKSNLLDIEESSDSINVKKSYSYISNQIILALMYDNLIKYGTISSNLSLYSKHYKIKYKSFYNNYNKIKKNDFYKYLDNKLLLSYTSMNDYFKCSFKYYLKYILKIDINHDITTRHIGSIFHYVLEKCIDEENYNIEKYVKKYIGDNNISMNSKERFFLNKLIQELPFLIDTIKAQNSYISLKERLYEEKIELKYNSKININFVGIIDKIIYDDDIYALVDYKTGNENIDLSLNYYGINMQLATYLFLASKKFKNAKFAGFYLQFILNKMSKGEEKEEKENKLKLFGYSNSKYISYFDKTYESSRLIKSLKLKNDGTFYSTSKILSDEQVCNLIHLVENKINECIEKIEECDFSINPKNIDGKNVSCEFCTYKDICFMNNKNILYLDKIDNFL